MALNIGWPDGSCWGPTVVFGCSRTTNANKSQVRQTAPSLTSPGFSVVCRCGYSHSTLRHAGSPRICRLTLKPSLHAARHAIIGVLMKARVFVTPKSTVLDPQGQAVCAALHGLGFAAIAEVRQGKFFEIAISSGISRQKAQTDIETIAHEVLANPVIEEYECRFRCSPY